jgi:hypothetical protein
VTTATVAPGAGAIAATNDPVDDRGRMPVLLGALCILISILPAFSVAPGPLKSNGSPAKILSVLLFGLAVLGFVAIRRTAATRSVRPGLVIIVLFFFLQLSVYAIGLTTVGSSLVEASKTRALISLVANVGVALYAFARVRTARQRDFVLGCLAIGLAFGCFVGLMQSMTSIDLRYLFEPPGFVQNVESDTTDLAERFGAKRVMGTSQHAIEFSVVSVAAMALTLYFVRHTTRPVVRVGALIAFVIALVAMPASVSRSGVIALAAAVALYVWNVKVRHLVVGIVAAALAVGAYMQMLPSVASALWNTIIHSEEDPSIMSRASDYALVSKTFHAHPIAGLGLGASPPAEYGYLDNQWLQAVVQGGLIGVTAMILLTAGGFFGVAAALRRATNRRERDQAYTLGAIFAATMACSFTFDLFAFEQASRILFLVVALLWCDFSSPLDEPDTAPAGSTQAPD